MFFSLVVPDLSKSEDEHKNIVSDLYIYIYIFIYTHTHEPYDLKNTIFEILKVSSFHPCMVCWGFHKILHLQNFKSSKNPQ